MEYHFECEYFDGVMSSAPMYTIQYKHTPYTPSTHTHTPTHPPTPTQTHPHQTHRHQAHTHTHIHTHTHQTHTHTHTQYTPNTTPHTTPTYTYIIHGVFHFVQIHVPLIISDGESGFPFYKSLLWHTQEK